MISLNNISIQFGGDPLFQEVSFLIDANDKVGLVGRNGAGKSTLFKLLLGEIQATEGNINVPREIKMGHLPQDIASHSEKSVREEASQAFEELINKQIKSEELKQELESRTDHSSQDYLDLIQKIHDIDENLRINGIEQIDASVEQILKGLGFKDDELDRPMNTFSGGWQMRVELAKLLLSKPDLLLLDEPTNHLDIQSIRWLEVFLKNYSGAILLISHDRYFLDNITGRTIEIINKGIQDYKASYSKYVKLRAERVAQQEAKRKNQEKELAQMDRNIERFRAKASKAKFAQSLIKKREKMDKVEVEDFSQSRMNLNFPEGKRSGEVVVKGKNLSKSYDDNQVLENINFEILRGERVAFIGKNGMGKSTLSKIIAGETGCEGKVDLGYNVELGYYAQVQPDSLNSEKTVLQEMEDEADDEMRPHLRSLLGAFLFSGEAVEKKVKVLSGGEKSRLALAKMLLSPSNFLLLDEPTNHLDMPSKEVLKNALNQFKGTLVVVSHDRDFLKGLTDQTWEFIPGSIKKHLFGIERFLEENQLEGFREFEEKPGKKTERNSGNDQQLPDSKDLYEKKKKEGKTLRKLENKLKSAEREIENIENLINEKEKLMADPDKLNNLDDEKSFYEEYEQAKVDLENKMEEWEDLVLQIDEQKKHIAKIQQDHMT